MIVSVISKDNVELFARVKAKNAFQTALAARELQSVAKTRTAEDLLGDDYYPTADLAATVRRPSTSVGDLVGDPLDDRHLS